MEKLAALIQANEAAAKAIAAAYELGLGGVPNQEGFTVLIDNLKATNFGSNNPNIVFNDENVFINVINALVQGNPTAAAAFAAITAGASSLADKVAAFYDELVPESAQSAEGLAYLTRPEALAFYAQVAAERGVAGPDGAAIVALASMTNVFVKADLAGIGDSVNDLYAAILDGSAVLPATGNTFTPIETADGTKFDADDGVFGQVTLKVGADIVSGTIFDAPRGFTPGGTDQVNTLNDDDELTGTGTADALNFTFVENADVPDPIITPVLNDVEHVNIKFSTDEATAILDLQDASQTGTEETSVNVSRIALSNTVAGVLNLGYVPTVLSVNNSNADSALVALGFTDKGAAGDNDSTTLRLNNAQVLGIGLQELGGTLDKNGSPIFGDQGIEHITIDSVGSANQVGFIAAEEVQDIKVTGDQDLTLGLSGNIRTNAGAQNPGPVEADVYTPGLTNVAGSLALIDASALTGDLDIVLGTEVVADKDGTSGVEVDFVLKGGAGDDTVRLLDGFDGKGDSIDGGAGENTVALYGGDLAVGSLTKFQHLEVRDQDPTAAVKVDTSLLPDLVDIVVRNEGNDGAGAPQNATSNIFLNNLSADVAKHITVEHGTTFNNDVDDLTVHANLKDATGTNDTVAIKIADAVNTDPRFNFTLDATKVENIAIEDADTESNTVFLSKVADHTASIVVTGGKAGTFLSLDAGPNGGINDQGIYGIEDEGNEDDAGTDNDNTGRAADQIGQNTGGSIRVISKAITADTLLSDLIVRVGAQDQTIKLGSGNDTVVFDALGSTTAGLTVADKVSGGDGQDTVAFEGDTRTVIGSSELLNVSGIETLLFVGNGAAAADLNANGSTTDFGENSYSLRLDDNFMSRNGTLVDGVTRIYVRNDNDLANDVDVTKGVVGSANNGLTIDATLLSASNAFEYNGQEGAGATADRFIVADAIVNGRTIIDGGASGNSAAGNADVLEVRQTAAGLGAQVTADDLANIKNVSTLEFVNRGASDVNHFLELTNDVVENLVNSFHTAKAGEEETLVIVADDNPDVPTAQTFLSVDASAVTNAFLRLNITGDSGNDIFIGGAGNDRIDGGAGADIVNGGGGADTFVFNLGDGVGSTGGLDNGAAGLSPGDQLFFGNGVDVINGFQDGVDILDFEGATNTDDSATFDVDAGPTFGINTGNYAVIDGTWNAATKTFTTGSGADTLVAVDQDTGAGVVVEFVVLVGVDHNLITAADFI